MAAGLALVAAFAVAGGTFNVNSTADLRDAQVGDGLCRTSAGTCTLRAAIQEANALPGAEFIELPAGTYQIAIRGLNQNDVTTGDFDITGSLTVRGAGSSSTIIDGGIPPSGSPAEVRGLDRLFEVVADGGSVAFIGLTLSDGYAAEYGGAIFNNSTASVSVIDAVLVGNVAGKTGGAIDNHVGGSLDVRNSTLRGNFARESGSAINNNRGGAVTIADSVIAGNAASAVGLDEALFGAGAIANNAELDARGSIRITGSEISENRTGAGRSGAGVSNDGGGTLTIDRTTFAKNNAAGDGGAIYNGTGEVTVTNSTFSENSAKDGGAIGSVGGLVEVLDSVFTKNAADDWGGGIWNGNQGSFTVRATLFAENNALTGGGLANEGTGLVTIENATFTKNAAVDSAVLAGGEGGGMHSNSGGMVTIGDSTFTENRALSGGGLSNEGGGQVRIAASRFSGNTADEQGGGILIQSGDVRMVDIDVVGNVANGATEGGGGISYAGDKSVSIGESAAIERSRIRDNKSNGEGGGIDSRGDGPLAITTSAITGNVAAIGGGVHHVGDAPLLVERSTVSGNTANNGGGVFTDGDGEATLENATISGNRAGQFGGGVLVSARLVIRHSTVTNNTAASGGGVNNGGGDFIGDGTVFVANSIVANSPTGRNCAGTITSHGGNLESANSCQLTQLSDQPGTDPRLGPLADNGGPTLTHALLEGSPAQDAAVCTDLAPCPPVDQRGVARPLMNGFDVGAYESELPPGGGTPVCTGRTERPIPADFDSWVARGSAGSNFGADSILKAGSGQHALVHFTLPPAPAGCDLVGATLRLHASAATDGRSLEALRLGSDWSEFGVTWSNQPAPTGAAAMTLSGLGYLEWDVLRQTGEMYASGAHGFLVRDAGGAGSQSFHSREKGAQTPELVLVFDDPDAPPPSGVCPTTTQLVFADRDAWVSQGSPSNNFGNDSTLKVKSQAASNARALLHFPLPALPGGCTSIASAVLRVEATSAKEGRTLEALQLASGWTESGVTWSTQPTASGPAAAVVSAQGVLEWDVTDQILGLYASSNHGLLIRDAVENGVGDEQTMNSRDKIGDGTPELVLAFDDRTPETTIDDGPPSPTRLTDAAFTFSSDASDATFECSLDGAAFERCTSPQTFSSLAEGDHRFEVRATRRIRAVDPTPASYEWTIAIPPETTISGPASPSTSADATLAFFADDPDATFECALNGAAFADCTSPIEYTALGDGEQEVVVRATDPLGNIEPDPASHSWTVAVPPETTITDHPPDPTNTTVASFAFSGTDNGTAPEDLEFECRLDSADASAFGACAAEYVDLAAGAHTFEVRAKDLAGQTDASPASYGWTIDRTPPTTSIDEQPANPTNQTTATFAVSGSDNHSAPEALAFECRLDGTDAVHFGTCPADYRDLAAGPHTFEVRAVDEAGNVEEPPASYSWTIDTKAPQTTIVSRPADPTNSTGAQFTFGADEPASFVCILDAGPAAACDGAAAYTGLAEGRHTFSVQATDPAGNVSSAASYAWVIDLTAPQTTIEGPGDPTNQTTATFALSGSDNHSAPDALAFECRLDGAVDFGTCPVEYRDLAAGAHTFEARATDEAGNVGSAASYAWVIDLTAPQTTIEGPGDPTNSPDASFTFSADEAASFECTLDAELPAACDDGSATYLGLPDGRHALSVQTTDLAGNVEEPPASYSWTIDTKAPQTTIVSRPADPTNSTGAQFTFGADEPASFVCILDAGPAAACDGAAAYTGLAEGRHTFSVQATDPAGNVGDAASYSWTVDLTAPRTTITGPDNPTTDTSARFEFSASEAASLACALDAEPLAACTSPVEYHDLAEGRHTFSVQATDRAGNVEEPAASYTWTIQSAAPSDTTPPNTTIDERPANPSNDPSPTFTFSGTDDISQASALTYRCRLDSTAEAAWTHCSSPYPYIGLGSGLHTFEVRARDQAGNIDPSPASYSWTIDTAAPQTTISGGPNTATRSTSATFTFSGSDETGPSSALAFSCALDDAAFAVCSSPVTYTGLSEGAHTFRVWATDRAGNVGAPASHPWTIDLTAPETTLGDRPANPTNQTSASFTFTGTDNLSQPSALRFECRLDASAFGTCESPRAYTGLSAGPHTFEARAIDALGNTDASPASYGWTIDTSAPNTTIDSGPSGTVTSRGATFTFSSSETGSTFQCSLDSTTAYTACTAPHTYSGLTIATHTFRVRAIDAAGNTDGSPASRSWTIAGDTSAPNTTIDSGPSGTVTTTTATFTFSSSESGSTFQCALDSTSAYTQCSSPHSYSGLAIGSHTFRVRATDPAGNTDGSPASRAWTIAGDTSAPNTTIDSGPSGTVTTTTATFTFSSSESGSTFECALDGAAFEGCTTPREYTGLSAGPHTFQVRARDAAGNLDQSPASRSWTVEVITGCGSPVTVTAAADAWIEQNSPSSNKGTDSILKVKTQGSTDNFRALVRFDLPVLPAGCVLQSATLRLYAASATSSRTLQVFRIDGGWTEGGVTWGSQPPTVGTAADAASGLGYREWAVTEQVFAMYGSANHGFLVRDLVEGDSGAEQSLHSREKGENPPQLVLRFAEGG